MNIETTKLELMYLLLQTQKEELLLKIKQVFEKEKIDWWNEISVVEQDEITNGISQANNGNFVSNESVMKHFKK